MASTASARAASREARDPNFIYADDDAHVCRCLKCSELLRRYYFALSDSSSAERLPVTLSPRGTPLRYQDWRLTYADGTLARFVVACHTGSAHAEPWVLSMSVYAADARHARRHTHALSAHRCLCGSGKPCMRVTHERLFIEYIGPVARHDFDVLDDDVAEHDEDARRDVSTGDE